MVKLYSIVSIGELGLSCVSYVKLSVDISCSVLKIYSLWLMLIFMS